MTDDQILDVIAKATGYPARCPPPITILARLRDAGYDTVPTDTAKLGRWVESHCNEFDDDEHRALAATIYAEAGVL